MNVKLNRERRSNRLFFPQPDRIDVRTRAALFVDRAEFPDDASDALLQRPVERFLEVLDGGVLNDQCDTAAKGVRPRVRMSSLRRVHRGRDEIKPRRLKREKRNSSRSGHFSAQKNICVMTIILLPRR